METSIIPEAFALLTFPDALLSSEEGTDQGVLILECVTYSGDTGLARGNNTGTGRHEQTENRDVILILRVNNLEVVLDPRRSVTMSAPEPNAARIYTFHSLPDDPSEVILTIPHYAPSNENASGFLTDLDTFDQVIEQYANKPAPIVDVPADAPWAADYFSLPPEEQKAVLKAVAETAEEDLRGRLILVDSHSGEILGPIGGQNTVNLDSTPQALGGASEHQPLLIDLVGDDLEAHQLFLRAIPPGEEDVISKTAMMLNNAIQGLTKIVANGITSASDYYITRATPRASVTNASGPTSTPAPRPIRWITSDRSKRNLSNIQGYSSQAVRISGKTMNIVEGLVARAVVPKPKTPHPTNPRASSRAKSDPIQPSPRGQVDLKLDPMPLKSRGQTVPGAKAKKTDLENDLLDVPAASDPPPVYSRNTPPPVHPASRTSSLQHVPLPVPSRVSSPAPPSLSVRRSSPVPRSLPPAPPTHPSVANRGSSSEALLQQSCNTGILPSPSPRPGSDSTSSATPQPREPLGISGRLVLSAALLSETMANSQAKLVSTSGDSVAAMMTRKYGIVAGTSTAAMIGTARDVTLVYMNTTGFVQDVTLRTAGRYVAQTQCNVGGRKYSLRTNGRGRVVQAEPA